MSGHHEYGTRRRAGALAVWVALACTALLVGCACSPYRAAWYAVEPAERAASAASVAGMEIQLALLNVGDRALKLEGLRVNPVRSADLFGTRDGVELGDVTLQPGRLHIINFTQAWATQHKGTADPPAACMLPVQIQASCGGWCRTQRVSGTLPNYLSEGWLQQCKGEGKGRTSGAGAGSPSPAASEPSSPGVRTP